MSGPLICVVDDDAALRDAIGMLLDSVGYDFRTFEDGPSFLEAAEDIEHAVAVLDIRMPGMSGRVLQEELKTRGYDYPIIFISGHADIDMAVAAMHDGAFDFMEKPFDDQKLLDTIDRAAKFEADAGKARARFDRLNECMKRLSPRELDVLERIVDGDVNKVIADHLGISERTVEVHRKSIMEKTESRSVAELVRRVIEWGEGRRQ